MAAVELTTDWDKVATLRDGLEGAVRAWRPDVVIAGGEMPRLPNISCVITPRLSGELQVMALDLAGVAVGVGAACSSGRIGPSHVLAAMSLPAALSGSAVRVSLGWSTGSADTARFVEAWSALATTRA